MLLLFNKGLEERDGAVKEDIGFVYKGGFTSVGLKATLFTTGALFSLRIDNGMSDFSDEKIILAVDFSLIYVGIMDSSGNMVDDKIAVFAMLRKQAF